MHGKAFVADVLINTDSLWDADRYWRSGKMPWTIFAYPANLADGRRLPPDDQAIKYLATLQQHGIRVGIWAHPDQPQTIYFACPYEDRFAVDEVVKELEQLPGFGPDFLSRSCEKLFAMAESRRA